MQPQHYYQLGYKWLLFLRVLAEEVSVGSAAEVAGAVKYRESIGGVWGKFIGMSQLLKENRKWGPPGLLLLTEPGRVGLCLNIKTWEI